MFGGARDGALDVPVLRHGVVVLVVVANSWRHVLFEWCAGGELGGGVRRGFWEGSASEGLREAKVEGLEAFAGGKRLCRCCF